MTSLVGIGSLDHRRGKNKKVVDGLSVKKLRLQASWIPRLGTEQNVTSGLV